MISFRKNAELSEAELYGYGLFETLKLSDRKLEFFDEHYQRLQEGAEAIKLPCPPKKALAAFLQKELASVSGTARVRINLLARQKTTEISCSIADYPYTSNDLHKGFALTISDYRKNSRSRLNQIKSCNYLELLLAKKEALHKGFNEALLFNEKDELCEGSFTNIFLRKGTKLYTPPLNTGILPGIIRNKIIQLCSNSPFELIDIPFGMNLLKTADEVFCTNSLLHVMPVYLIDSMNFSIYKREASQYFQHKLNEINNEGSLWILNE